MQRTQISLTEEARNLLDAGAARTGRSISALIRDAITKTYGYRRNVDQDVQAIDARAALDPHLAPLDEQIAEIAGELGRRWLPSHRGVDSAHLAIAATAVVHGASLLTCNVKHFPMFSGLTAPY